MKNKLFLGSMSLFLVLGCSLIEVVPAEPTPLTEIPPDMSTEVNAQQVEVAQEQAPDPEASPTLEAGAEGGENSGQEQPPAEAGEAEAPPAAEIGPTPEPTTVFLQSLSSPSNNPRALPRNGLLIAFVLPLLCMGLPWFIFEFFYVRYVQPKGIDLSAVLVKAQDGLFVEAVIALTARRTQSLAATRMTWDRVQEFVEKPLEQELIHRALEFPTLDDLERNLSSIAVDFRDLIIVRELLVDFGVEVMRFNIEARYPQETMDALNRKAEAAAGGKAYIAYAEAAHLDPYSRESRELYRVYQETRGQVDAARNLGAGLSNFAGKLGQGGSQDKSNDDS